MKNAYSFYFHIRQITELETFKIWSRLKNQRLHTWSETYLWSIKASRQKSYEECILILLPYSLDYGTWDLQNLKSFKKSTSTSMVWNISLKHQSKQTKMFWRMHTHITSIFARLRNLDLQNLKKKRDSRKSLEKSNSTYMVLNGFF